ncbi:hypothetical protein [Stenotrophomonas sepilia]|uniref:hypothetical protein n=1 Tax=Stenotrophomonas sepilia TaxID=2860290 RepID=UPI002E77A147|nr:hypothetical protein [Stenotrophomonas sepilia]
MTTYKKTLADVQPGGRVRLGDAAPTHDQQTIERVAKAMQASEQSQSGWTWADCSPIEVEGWMDLARAAVAALSAQPSPGGQGDALDLVMGECEEWFDTTDVDMVAAAESIIAALSARQPVRIYGCCAQPEGELHTAECPNMQHLTARQPVGEPLAWMTHHDEPMLFPAAAEAAAYCEDDEQPVPLFRAPAQAVDLGRWSQRHAEDLEQAIHTALSAHAGSLSQKKRAAISAYVKRLLIDSKAVGNE